MARIAVIGSGFGGLALAVRLQSAGHDVTLFEARDKPGGRAYVYEERGYTFDAGPTVVTDPTCLEALFALSGRRLADYVDLMPVEPFYRLHWPDGTTFDYTGNEAQLSAEIAALSPGDVEGYRRFFAYSEGVLREGYETLGHEAFLDFRSMLAAAPQLMRYGAWRSVHSVVARHVRHPKLREAFSFHTLLVGGNPFKTSSIYALIHALEKKWGVWFPRGGTHALVRGLVRLFADLGGTLKLAAPVTAIETAGNRVTGLVAEGERHAFDAVASNGDVVHTYADLLGATVRGKAAAKALERKRFSPSLFVVHFGARGTWPEVPHHNILFGPRYRALLDDIYGNGVLADDFSLYLHHPTASDPGLSPPGCSSFYALSPVPHLGKYNCDWERIAPEYADRILRSLDAHLLSGLLENIEVKRWFTPSDFRTELKAHLGSAFSLEPVLWQSAWFRVHNRDDVIPNLYFVGAGTHPGAGIPGVVASARATARLMLGDLADG